MTIGSFQMSGTVTDVMTVNLVSQVEHTVFFSFFLFSQVLVTQTTEGFSEPQEIKTLGVGDYFGEKALIRFGVSIICVKSVFNNSEHNQQ